MAELLTKSRLYSGEGAAFRVFQMQFFSPPLAEGSRMFHFGFHSENFLMILEVKVHKITGPPKLFCSF